VRVTDVHLGKDVVHWPDMILRRTPMHHDDQGTLATEKVDEKLEESVDGEGFVHVADRLDELCRRQGHERNPRRNRVDRDHEQNTDDITLEEWLAVVFAEHLSVPVQGGSRTR